MGCRLARITCQSFLVVTDDHGKKYLYMSHTKETKNWGGGGSLTNAWNYSDTRACGIYVEGVHLNIMFYFATETFATETKV